MNDENLIPANRLSESERREFGRIGGKASVAARRRKKDIKEMLEIALSAPEHIDAIKRQVAEVIGIANPTNAEVIVARLILDAKKGNIQATKEILDRLYGKPTQPTDITTGGQPLINIEVQSERGKAEIEKIVK